MGKLEIQGSRLPISIAAGVVKTPEDFELIYQNQVICAVTPGTYTQAERVVPDSYFQWDKTTQSAQNRMRFPNPGREAASNYLPAAIEIMRAAGVQVVISVGVEEHEDPQVVLPEMAAWAVAVGADGVELNPVCPNLDSQYPFSFKDPLQVAELAHNTRRLIGRNPILAYKVPNLAPLIMAQILGEDPPVDVWTAINSIAGQSGPQMRGISRVNTRDWAKAIDAAGLEAQVVSTLGIAGNREGGHEAYFTVNSLGAFAVGLAQHPYRLKGKPKAFGKIFTDMEAAWNKVAAATDRQTAAQQI